MATRLPTLPPRVPPRPAEPARPPDEPGDGGGGGGWVFLMTADGAIEAELVRGYLESAGVPVALDHRDPSPGAWMFLSGNMRAPVRVFVPKSMLDAARLELLEAGFSAPEPAAAPDSSEPARRFLSRSWTVALVAAVVVVAVWILLLQSFGAATCTLRLAC